VTAELGGRETDETAWRFECGAVLTVAVTRPIGVHDFDALLDAIIDELRRCYVSTVVLPAQIPTDAGMAAELQASLEHELRDRGFQVTAAP
jgi:hypothetical protein